MEFERLKSPRHQMNATRRAHNPYLKAESRNPKSDMGRASLGVDEEELRRSRRQRWKRSPVLEGEVGLGLLTRKAGNGPGPGPSDGIIIPCIIWKKA